MTAVATVPRGDAAAVLAAGELRYSTVWEDHRLLERGLRPVAGDDVLVIASAGCNALNLLLGAPRRLVAVDINPAQTALLALKLAAVRTLPHDATLRLLGVRDAADRLALYERARPALPSAARDWWDARLPLLHDGVEEAGRLDRYIARFRREGLHEACGAGVVDRLLALDDRAARRRLVDAELFTPAFVAAFRAHFGREPLAAHGRAPAQFEHVAEPDVAGAFLARLYRACTALPVRGNFYLERFLRGGVRNAEWGPPYLRRGAYERLRALAPRVEVVTGALEEHLARCAPGSLGGAALSDVFEYLAPDASDALFALVRRALRPGGRVAYWNLFVPRRSPPALSPRLRPLARLSGALARRDRAWFYGAFHVEEACDS